MLPHEWPPTETIRPIRNPVHRWAYAEADACILRPSVLGSRLFAARHRDELRDAYLLNFDGVGAGGLCILTAEPMYRTKLTEELCTIAAQAAQEDGLTVSMCVSPFGGTDAANFIHAGLRATSVAGISKPGFL